MTRWVGVKESEWLTTTTAETILGYGCAIQATRKQVSRESESERHFLARFLFSATFPRLWEDFYSASPPWSVGRSQPSRVHSFHASRWWCGRWYSQSLYRSSSVWGKFRGHNDDVDERRRDAGCWLVQLYQLSGNRCVCVRRGTIQGCGLELGCLFFSTNLLLFSLLFVSTPYPPIFSFPTHRPRYNHTPDHHISIFRGSAGREATRHWLRVSVSHSSSSSVAPHSYRDRIPQKAVS